jgi:putative DNA primase/helicase
MTDIHEVAHGRWKDVFMSLGMPIETLQHNKPCVFCGGRDRASYLEYPNTTVYFCRHCGSHTPIDVMMQVKGMEFKEVADTVRGLLGHMPAAKFDKKPQIDYDKINRTLRGVKPVKIFDAVSDYLMNRGIFILPESDLYLSDSVMGWADSERTISHVGTGMIGKIRDVEGKVVGLHKTFIEDGKKAPIHNPKQITGSKGDGGCIRLFDVSHTVGLAEGIEDALAAKALYGIPTWACIDARNLEKAKLPLHIKTVFIYSDNDDSFVGQLASYTLAKRLKEEGRQVEVIVSRLKDVNEDLKCKELFTK